MKLYSADVVKLWERSKIQLPDGVTVTQELEGVNGQSGSIGSGRTGPIDVTDSEPCVSSLGLST